jgi:hypothetical protein
VAADGWLYVSGQVAMENGEVIDGGIVAQSHKAIQNVLAILKEAGYGPEHVVRCGVWLDDRATSSPSTRSSRNTSAPIRRHVPAWSPAWWWTARSRWIAWPSSADAARAGRRLALVPRNQGKQGKKNKNNKRHKRFKRYKKFKAFEDLKALHFAVHVCRQGCRIAGGVFTF